jgi:hypothetical protein
MATSQNTNTLHYALAQYFSLDELKLLCHDAGINPESVPYSERGIQLFAFCFVESFRRKELLPALLAQCAKERREVDWNAFAITTTVPAEWTEPTVDERNRFPLLFIAKLSDHGRGLFAAKEYVELALEIRQPNGDDSRIERYESTDDILELPKKLLLFGEAGSGKWSSCRGICRY